MVSDRASPDRKVLRFGEFEVDLPAGRLFRQGVRVPLRDEFISTRIGNLPWNSGIRSEGFVAWNAPAAMNRMWSVRTMP